MAREKGEGKREQESRDDRLIGAVEAEGSRTLL